MLDQPFLLPQGKFAGYTRNGLAALPADDEITRVMPGTPCGEYLRRFWMPIALTAMVGGLPLRLRRLGEDLVLFRDGSGAYGLLHLLCSHRNASLEFGTVEQHGIRCCHHGWLFDTDGTILETPGEPATSQIRNRLCHGAYPVIEHKGLIFAYFGPIAEMPDFPLFDTMNLPGDRMVPSLVHSAANWLQVFESAIDPYHAALLHVRGAPLRADTANLPVVDYHERAAGNGVFYTVARRVKDLVWFRVHDHMLPNFSQDGGMQMEGSEPAYFMPTGLTSWVVPVDDTNAVTVAWRHCNTADDCPGQLEAAGDARHWRGPGDGQVWASEGTITVHAREHLGRTDTGVVLFRHRLRRAVRRLAAGEAPLQPSTNVTTPIPTYGGDTVLRAPANSNDDPRFMSDLSKRVADIYRASDGETGETRRGAIRRALRELEAGPW